MGGTTSNKRPAPWAIRGVTAEARNAAMSAARREGMALGEWLDRGIRQLVKQQRHDVPAAPLEQTLAELVKQMQADREDRQRERDELAARISAVEARTEAEAMSRASSGGNFLARLYGLLRAKQPLS
jgi:hypothetical protein